MNGQRASYSCTALNGTNKAGVVKCDADGYYDVVLGALNFYNSQGAYYPFDSAKELFSESSDLMRRINNACLKGECGHPKREVGMSFREFFMRVLNIFEDKVSHHIRRVYIDDQNVKDRNGNRVIAVRGEIKPAGPMGPALKEALENRHENVCFSIRSLTNDITDSSGRVIKNITKIITWDWVTEPGISVANKYAFPSLESLSDVTVTFESLQAIVDSEPVGLGLESNVASVKDAMKAFGWDSNKPKPRKEKKGPPSSMW